MRNWKISIYPEAHSFNYGCRICSRKCKLLKVR
jgi:hypothetical protein